MIDITRAIKLIEIEIECLREEYKNKDIPYILELKLEALELSKTALKDKIYLQSK